LSNKVNKLSGTIAAQASAQGVSGISVIRVSGNKSKSIAKKVTGKTLTHMKAQHTDFFDSDGVAIDNVVVLFFASPASYTGEDVLEISCHGSVAVVDEILKTLYEQGARQANAGEFTKRAFLNDKLDLTQAEAVADLIESGSAETARAAKNSLEGLFSKKILNLLDAITELRANIEASLDFPEEDLEQTGHNQKIKKMFSQTNKHYLSLLEETRVACKIREGLVVAITGEPNVGKSTLLNRLCGHERAIVSETPGTTRDTIEVETTIDGYRVCFIDTAGLRETTDAVEQEGIRRTRETINQADLVIEVRDARKESNTKERAEQSQLIVFNKTDLLKTKHNKAKNKELYVSALTGLGIEAVVENIGNRFKKTGGVELTMTARRRHLVSLNESFDAFGAAKKKTTKSVAGDIVAEDLLQAQNSLSEITGEFTNEELLDSIFNRFCIGK
jgi:tRNA modification GTPase